MKFTWSLLFILLVPVLFCFMLIGMDTIYLLLWWASILLVGLIFLPLTSKIFSSFFDKGYLFSKTIGLALLTFSLWLLSSFRILPFTSVSVYIILAVGVVLVYIVFKGFTSFKSLFKDFITQKTFIFEEAAFLLCMVLFAFVKGHSPSNGIEMPMDFAFLNNLLHTKFMPPVDMWFAGVPANYYYYGHYVFAFLTKLTNIDSTITYNLGIITLFAFGFTLTFSLTANLVYLMGKQKMRNIILAGLISACVLSLGGNLHTLVYGEILPAAKSIGTAFGVHLEVKDYFYPDARSYLGFRPDTPEQAITEFPAYSFILGDLHAQIIDIIFVLTFLALLLAFLLSSVSRIKKKERQSKWYNIPKEILLMILLLPVMWMTNAWDFPIYITASGAIILYVSLLKYDFKLEALLFTIIDSLKILVMSLLLLVPFLIRFINPTEGVKLTHLLHIFNIRYLFQFTVVWGYQIFFVILFMVFIFRTEPRYILQINSIARRKSMVQMSKKNGRKGLSQATSTVASQVAPSVVTKENFFAKARKFLSEASIPDIFVLIISICALGLILVSEVIYQKDVSGVGSYRSNTVWKVGLQAFIMFDIVIGYITVRVFSTKRLLKNKTILTVIIVFLLGSTMFYPIYSLTQPYPGNYKNLDVLTGLKKDYPDDYNVVIWMRKNIQGQPVVLEANGQSYWNAENKDPNRISIGTGFPTVFGWFVHEWYWRGQKNFNQLDKRDKEVRTVYTSDDINATKDILKNYDVKYIVVGNIERTKYTDIKEPKLMTLGTVIYASGTTKLIEVTKFLQ